MVTVRRARPEDAEAVAAVYAPAVSDGYASFEEQPPDAAEMATRMAASLLWLVAEVDGQVVGWAYGSRHRDRAAYRWSADVSVYLAAGREGQGLGRALYDVLLPALADQGLASLYAGISLPNAGSVALHERCGFRPIGAFPRVGFKHGRWHDVGWWWLPLHDRPAP